VIIDLHAHVLPGVDDGPDTIEECVAAVAAAAEAGVSVLAATPHVRSDYPTTLVEMETHVRELAARVTASGLATSILTGAELSLDAAVSTPDAELLRFGLGGSGSLLIEFPYDGWPPGLARELERLQARGFRLVLAHPERNPEVQAAPGRLNALVEEGVLVQLTASSVAGTAGQRTQSTALRLLELGLAHMLASDMHGAFRGGTDFHGALERLRDPRLGRWLTYDVPSAVIGDDEIPTRPEAVTQRLRWRR
jgi:protein-tyrosine phosphatase